MADETIKVLLIEDNPGDVYIIREMLAEAGEEIFLEDLPRLSSALKRIEEGGIDLIISDLGLPDSQGIDTVKQLIVQAEETPIVVLTGLADDATGVRAVKEGAQDYLVKGRIDGYSLTRTIRYAIERKRLEREREQLIRELQAALATVKTLSGFLPICASCKKIRNDKGYWEQIEAYISEHSEAEFSHGICPDCARRLYPEFFAKDRSEEGKDPL
ncbi:MAG: response regulator [Thermodesulfovibrionales bacterium]|jgi:DNA-binding NtrC family response regulator